MDVLTDTPPRPLHRVRVRVRGTVQGVGFRPFVYRQATERGMTGWVCNDGDGVLAEVQGDDVAGFIAALRHDAPPLARVDRCEATPIEARPDHGFAIVATGNGPVATAVTPDAAVCRDCESFRDAGKHFFSLAGRLGGTHLRRCVDSDTDRGYRARHGALRHCRWR